MKNVNVCFFASKHHTELHTSEKIFLEAYLLQDILECRTLIRQNFLKTKLNLPVFKINFLVHVINTQKRYAKKRYVREKKMKPTKEVKKT